MRKLKYHTMETENIFFTGNASSNSMLESSLSDLYFQQVSSSQPDDEEDDDDDTDEDTEERKEYKGDSASNDDPPLDKEVVHSPVTTLPGGVPKKN